MNRPDSPSINRLAAPLADSLARDRYTLRIGVEDLPGGGRLVDAGIDHDGGIEAGRRIAEICLGGLGEVRLLAGAGRWPLAVSVHTANPVLACLGSQYAGWSLAHGEGKGAFRALGSGPGRALAGKEELFGELGYRDDADSAALVLETDRRPPAELIEKIVRDCRIPSAGLTLILTPTRSLAGTVQIVARVLEVALHKVHALGFPLGQVVDGAGHAPLPTPGADFLTAMGRTNDAILFGGTVQLFVRCGDDEARDLARRLPSSASRDYGRPFARIFEEVKYDFYAIDPMLFAPARVVVSNLDTGASFAAGAIDEALIDASFGGEAA
ncbi:MAG TPA: methenyltetrahydromethanopterin cyclohydrolase [Rhodocyclaceae bacterium]|jgi:methenyltetrahydromethanopterin cyclohydrolase|nr:methenyltetrahydromethanopterin cyclohydrolase [Rhodocyclaceae bacterium]